MEELSVFVRLRAESCRGLCTPKMGFGTMRTGFGTMSVMIITLDVDGDLSNADVGGGADCCRPDHVRYPNEVSP
jgi:hypothetical protein